MGGFGGGAAGANTLPEAVRDTVANWFSGDTSLSIDEALDEILAEGSIVKTTEVNELRDIVFDAGDWKDFANNIELQEKWDYITGTYPAYTSNNSGKAKLDIHKTVQPGQIISVRFMIVSGTWNNSEDDKGVRVYFNDNSENFHTIYATKTSNKYKRRVVNLTFDIKTASDEIILEANGETPGVGSNKGLIIFDKITVVNANLNSNPYSISEAFDPNLSSRLPAIKAHAEDLKDSFDNYGTNNSDLMSELKTNKDDWYKIYKETEAVSGVMTVTEKSVGDLMTLAMNKIHGRLDQILNDVIPEDKLIDGINETTDVDGIVDKFTKIAKENTDDVIEESMKSITGVIDGYLDRIDFSKKAIKEVGEALDTAADYLTTISTATASIPTVDFSIIVKETLDLSDGDDSLDELDLTTLESDTTANLKTLKDVDIDLSDALVLSNGSSAALSDISSLSDTTLNLIQDEVDLSNLNTDFSKIENLITRLDDYFSDLVNQEASKRISSFNSRMASINATNSSAFIIGNSLLEREALRGINQHRSDLIMKEADINANAILQEVQHKSSAFIKKLDFVASQILANKQHESQDILTRLKHESSINLTEASYNSDKLKINKQHESQALLNKIQFNSQVALQRIQSRIEAILTKFKGNLDYTIQSNLQKMSKDVDAAIAKMSIDKDIMIEKFRAFMSQYNSSFAIGLTEYYKTILSMSDAYLRTYGYDIQASSNIYSQLRAKFSEILNSQKEIYSDFMKINLQLSDNRILDSRTKNVQLASISANSLAREIARKWSYEDKYNEYLREYYKIKLATEKEEHDRNLEIDVKDKTWKLSAYQLAGNVMAQSSGGAGYVPNNPSQQQNAVGTALSAGAAGLKFSGGNPLIGLGAALTGYGMSGGFE
jgi:hypothetical protein